MIFLPSYLVSAITSPEPSIVNVDLRFNLSRHQKNGSKLQQQPENNKQNGSIYGPNVRIHLLYVI